MTDDRDPLIGTTLADRYRVVARIGQGGAGHVYRGIQLQLEREVAIKVVRPDVPDASREELEARFFREASLAGRLSHPNIVQTIDYGSTNDGRQFVVMELLRGRTLKRALKSPMDHAEVARLGSAIARGLHHAHSKGLVHRDVKTSNIFLVKDDEGVEHPKLLDFGLVKSVRRELDITQTPTYLGTPLYMSPEQARGEIDLDARSDIYGLGCMLYRMACGEMPFRAETAMATALMHVSDPIPPMSERAPDQPVDAALEAIIRRCLEKAPDDRYDDAAALARALDDWREAQERPVPVTASDDGSRSFFGAIMGAVGVLGVLGILAGGAAIVVAIVLVVGIMLLPTLQESSIDAQGADAPGVAPVPRLGEAGGPDRSAGERPTREELLDEMKIDLDAVRDAPSEDAIGDAETDAPVPVETVEQSLADEGIVDGFGGDELPTPTPPADDEAPRRNVGEDGSATDVGGTPPVTDPVVVPKRTAPAPPWTPVTVDKYEFRTRAHADATVSFANSATRDELLSAGVSGLTVDSVIGGRPYADVEALGATSGVGPGTMYKLATHARKGL